jgi:hypothetical protein
MAWVDITFHSHLFRKAGNLAYGLVLRPIGADKYEYGRMDCGQRLVSVIGDREIDDKE